MCQRCEHTTSLIYLLLALRWSLDHTRTLNNQNIEFLFALDWHLDISLCYIRYMFECATHIRHFKAYGGHAHLSYIRIITLELSLCLLRSTCISRLAFASVIWMNLISSRNLKTADRAVQSDQILNTHQFIQDRFFCLFLSRSLSFLPNMIDFRCYCLGCFCCGPVSCSRCFVHSNIICVV